MHESDRALGQSREVVRASGAARWRSDLRRRLTSGGTDGNESLTTITGAVLLVLLLVIGVTIVRIGQLMSVHLFVGLLLIGPVALKLASTGYRFARYYTGNAVYRGKGPPETILRTIAPVLVLCTVTVFVSGVILMFEGRAHRDPMLLIHKVSFIVWGVAFGMHVLGHLPELIAYVPGRSPSARARELRDLRGRLPGLAAPARAGHELPADIPGRGGRSIALAGALVAGLVIAIVLIPQFVGWTNHA